MKPKEIHIIDTFHNNYRWILFHCNKYNNVTDVLAKKDRTQVMNSKIDYKLY